MTAKSLFVTHPVESWVVASGGLAGFVIATVAGIERWSALSANASGLILGIVSGALWYLASVAPLHWPDRVHLAAGLNAGAACAASGAACYLIPDDTFTHWTALFTILS